MRTLAFPYTDAMARPVCCYTFTSDLNDSWQDLTRRYTREPKQLPYRDLTLALRYVSRDYATIRKDPGSAGSLLLTRKKLDPDILSRLFAAFERALAARYGKPFDDILATQLRDLRPRTVKIANHLQAGGNAPAWVYDVATWHAIELLKGKFKLPNGEHIVLRPDTDGNLVAFDHPLPEQHPRGEQGIHYISCTPMTLPGYPGILLNLDAHISATTGWPGNARSLWIAPDDAGLLLTSSQTYDRVRNINLVTGMLPELTDSFAIDGVPTEFTAADLRDAKPRIRARHATTPDRHPIAAGPGRKFLETLLEHATARLGTESLTLDDSKIRNLDAPSATGNDPADTLSTAILAAAHPLQLSVVYTDDIQRARAATAITDLLDIASGTLTTSTATLLNGSLTVTFTSAPAAALIDPGPADRRTDLIADICQHVAPDARHIALLDTSRQQAAKGPDTDDPKHQIRQALAARGTVSQFLDTASAPAPDKTDHPARAALRDLLRAAGLTATTPTRAFAKPFTAHQPCIVVGISSHERQRPARRTVSLAALVTDGSTAPWQLLGYHPDAHGWNELPNAIAAHHATVLTRFDHRDAEARASHARDYAERALHQLRARFDDLPIVIYLDTSERFPVWPGLPNNNLASTEPGRLPHLALPNRHNIAVIRVGTSTGRKLPQPVRDLVARQGTDPALVPGSTKLYHLPGSTADVYYLVNRSRSDQAKDFGVRPGHRMTRFEVTSDENALRTPWHAMTCTEFVVLEHGSFSREQLAALSARLCGHPLSWDGRTSLPAPVHLAVQILNDHPDRNINSSAMSGPHAQTSRPRRI
ncbi:RNaseH domain-containing protein [Dactylosporangium sp. NPDC049525]|uniref:RNaseH domain-containing protein n=1 Tax=Dactylosporangium sp. NPDC049525 TaxID=3154730 RepID=UPI00342B0DCC